jgi:hypothetical protein
MELRHKNLRMIGATHDFNTYQPHITLSYDVGEDFDVNLLPIYNGPLEFDVEYIEPLQLDWSDNK